MTGGPLGPTSILGPSAPVRPCPCPLLSACRPTLILRHSYAPDAQNISTPSPLQPTFDILNTQYSICGKTRGGRVRNVFLTYFDYFSGGQYKLGGLRGTRGRGLTPPSPLDKSSTVNIVQILASFSILQIHHTSISLCPFQTMQLVSIPCQCFSPMSQSHTETPISEWVSFSFWDSFWEAYLIIIIIILVRKHPTNFPIPEFT